MIPALIALVAGLSSPAAAHERALAAEEPFAAVAAYLRVEEVLAGGPREERRRFLEEAASAASPFVRARAELALARLDVQAGDLEGAAERFAAVGLAEEALLIGPFDNTGGARLDEPTPPEAEGLSAGLQAGEVEDRTWQRVEVWPRRAAFDLDAHLSASAETRALLVLGVASTEARPAALRIGASGQVVAFVDGREVLHRDAHRPLGLDQDVVPVTLGPGVTPIVLRLGNLEGAFQARVRVTAPDGTPLDGVTFTADPELLAAALEVAPKRVASGRGADHPVDDPLAGLAAFVDRPPLHRPPTAGEPDRLRDAILVEETVQSRDQRARPPAHHLWRLALLLRLRTQPPSAERDALLADTLVAIGRGLLENDPTQARQRFEEALTVEPDHAEALLALARMRSDQELVGEAVALYRRALEAAPDDDAVAAEAFDGLRLSGWRQLELDRAILARGEASPQVEMVRLAADVAEERGDRARAWALGRRLADWDRGDPVGHRLTVQRLEARLTDDDDEGALDALIEQLAAYLAQHPGGHRHARRLALVLDGAGRSDEADRLVARRIERFPALHEGHALAAEVALWRGDREAAREALRRALALSPQERDLRTILRTVDEEGADLARQYALDVEALLGESLGGPLPDGAEDAGAHIEAQTVAARFFSNGLGTVYEEQVLRVHDGERAAGLREISFPYTAGREVVEVIEAVRVRSDGSAAEAEVTDRGPGGKVGGVYTDARSTLVDFGPLQAGDVLHVRVRTDLIGRQSLFGDFFGRIEPIQRAVPGRNFRVVIEVPADRPLAFGGRGAPSPAISTEGAWRVYDFRRPQAARIEPEQSMPPWLEVADYLSVSSVDRWEELGDWYEQLIADQLRLDDELRAIARREVKGARSVEEKVRRLYEYVVGHTRYVGIELGIHGWRPYPVTEVHRRRYGDCKDKASLLIALLDAVGIEGRIALVRTADLGALSPQPPSMWAFNHAIAYVPALDLFLDGTSEHGAYRELPPLDQGAMALVVAPYSDAEPALVTIPVDPADANLNRSDYDLRLGPDGSLRVRGEERFRGALAARERATLHDEGRRKEQLEQALADPLPGAQVHEVEAVGVSLSSEEAGYDFTATIPHRATRRDNGGLQLPLSLYPHGLTEGWAQRSQREHDVWLAHPWRTRNVMRYRLPEGYSVRDLPAGGEIDTPHLRFVQKVTRTEDGFVVEEDTTLKSRRIPAADYPAFRKAAARADALMTRAVILDAEGPDA